MKEKQQDAKVRKVFSLLHLENIICSKTILGEINYNLDKVSSL